MREPSLYSAYIGNLLGELHQPLIKPPSLRAARARLRFCSDTMTTGPVQPMPLWA